MANKSKKINVAIFGFGRIGRNIFRLAFNDPRFKIVAISEFGPAEALHYLVARDSIHGKLNEPIELLDNHLVIGNQKVAILPGATPGMIPWSTMDVDFVIDATGAYLKRDELAKHIKAGAKRVIVSRTPDDRIDRMIIHGINENAKISGLSIALIMNIGIIKFKAVKLIKIVEFEYLYLFNNK